MKSIQVSMLASGTVADSNYYSDKGELLVSKGVIITEHFLETFRRRNIFEIFVKQAGEDDELHSILSQEFKNLGAVDLDDQAVQKFQDLREIKPGKDGLQQLLRSEKAHALDKELSSSADRPIGPALSSKATEMTVADRTDTYKLGVAEAYAVALKEVKYILDTLATGGKADGQDIQRIVDNFVSIFVSDRNILLNISGLKHSSDEYIYHHSLNVCLLSINIAASAGYSESQVKEIGMGALLHDIGMLLIPARVRAKTGRLTTEEWFEVQKHPILGLHLLEKVSRLPRAIPYVAYQVHERENSTGYPKMRNSRLIHRFAKMAQIADVYEALTSPRTYRRAYTPHEGVIRLIKMSKAGMVPGDFVKSFVEYASLYPVGSLVELSDHRIAKVVQANRNSLGKPVVSVLTNSIGRSLEKSNISQIDLSKDLSVQIVKALPSDQLKNVDIMLGF
jgi:HD-GYP domain-containing protein (c-di-GMP phosphodiesterase class II)